MYTNVLKTLLFKLVDFRTVIFRKIVLCVCDNGEVLVNRVDITKAETQQYFSFNLVHINNYNIFLILIFNCQTS